MTLIQRRFSAVFRPILLALEELAAATGMGMATGKGSEGAGSESMLARTPHEKECLSELGPLVARLVSAALPILTPSTDLFFHALNTHIQTYTLVFFLILC